MGVALLMASVVADGGGCQVYTKAYATWEKSQEAAISIKVR